MTVICSVDIGIKNPAYTIFRYEDSKVSLIAIEKSDWSDNWEYNVTKDLTKYNPDIVVLEKQGYRSPNAKIIYFIKGFFYNTNTLVIVRNPTFQGGSYSDRKKQSVITFIDKLSRYSDHIDDILSSFTKLDDIADSFNLGIAYIESTFKKNVK
ncbi:MPPV-271 Holliday junction resolvase protein [Magpiepox virus 2]|nr:Holliday junction resolvase protein [Magpiepox virus]QZW33592.1 MPPV-271 Holliday junction resolvase protein [Magpiepox virus 2]